jgi:hypothetical protein
MFSLVRNLRSRFAADDRRQGRRRTCSYQSHRRRLVSWADVANPITYDPATDRITLQTVDNLFEDYYRLEMDGDGSDLDGTPGIADLRGNFLERGDFTALLDFTSLGMVQQLIDKVEALGLSTGTENSLVGKLEATVHLLGVDMPSDAGVLALLAAFRRGVDQWYSRDEISEEDHDDLLVHTDVITLGIMLDE